MYCCVGRARNENSNCINHNIAQNIRPVNSRKCP